MHVVEQFYTCSGAYSNEVTLPTGVEMGKQNLKK